MLNDEALSPASGVYYELAVGMNETPLLFNQITGELNATPSDRAVAVLGASVVEAALRELLLHTFVNHKDVKEYISRATAGPLQKIAFGAGLISQDLYCDVKEIAAIRNQLAHKYSIQSFDQEPVSKAIDRLWAPVISDEKESTVLPLVISNPQPVKNRSRRDRFIFTVASSSFFIQELTIATPQVSVRVDNYMHRTPHS